MDQDIGTLSPRTFGELTESVRQIQIRRSPESMSVDTPSPTGYRDSVSSENILMNIQLHKRSVTETTEQASISLARGESASGITERSHSATHVVSDTNVFMQVSVIFYTTMLNINYVILFLNITMFYFRPKFISFYS
ncbi:hypothetical protein AX774_g4275 [Zancudomyces culisetae]|uniref:Uncharacterized protein n=1 Tax=Zancudomyces culisetae TaxID=1213189 RepID=A0A1R1PMR4_ZANCU|nr:hypothetical protein AX774_g4275 [Zancudomyces culisetae]|eukprot:OMH82249.1 hypothetical protein AX774_g4275 [Zancudomyces culisetae]